MEPTNAADMGTRYKSSMKAKIKSERAVQQNRMVHSSRRHCLVVRQCFTLTFPSDVVVGDRQGYWHLVAPLLPLTKEWFVYIQTKIGLNLLTVQQLPFSLIITSIRHCQAQNSPHICITSLPILCKPKANRYCRHPRIFATIPHPHPRIDIVNTSYHQSTTLDTANMSNVLGAKDPNVAVGNTIVDPTAKPDIKSMEYHRQVLVNKIEQGQYVLPSHCSSPATQDSTN